MVRLRDSGGKRYLKCLNSYGVLRIVYVLLKTSVNLPSLPRPLRI